jgi:hypothetical protein
MALKLRIYPDRFDARIFFLHASHAIPEFIESNLNRVVTLISITRFKTPISIKRFNASMILASDQSIRNVRSFKRIIGGASPKRILESKIDQCR